MEYLANSGMSYEIPRHGIYVKDRLWKHAEANSKYFDLERDTEVGFHLRNMDDMRQQYLKDVCQGVPWENPS
ncbi:MAG: hypothetical protein HFI88_03330 [Lachnospiraceae bacterium]|nr:hypothetical protein [Lachnospiraceae bacterium]